MVNLRSSKHRSHTVKANVGLYTMHRCGKYFWRHMHRYLYFHFESTVWNEVHCSLYRLMTIFIQCEPKNPPWGFVAIFPKRLGIFQPYFTFLSTLEYAFLFNYLQLWWSYAILSVTTHSHSGGGRGEARGAFAPGGTFQGAAFWGAKIWNFENFPFLANWCLHRRTGWFVVSAAAHEHSLSAFLPPFPLHSLFAFPGACFHSS